MAFHKRPLTEAEFQSMDWEALGIRMERRPKRSNWSWSIDEESYIFYTQLLSSSMEMRDGMYYYLLLIDKQPIVFNLTGHLREINKYFYPVAEFLEFGAYRHHSHDQLVKLANEAALADSPSIPNKDNTISYVFLPNPARTWL